MQPKRGIDYSRTPVSRRTLLTALGIGVADTAVRVHYSLSEPARDYELRRPPPLIHRSGVIDLLLTEHNAEAWAQHKDSIKETVAAYDVIIPEYLPVEYKEVLDRPVIGPIIRTNDRPETDVFYELQGHYRMLAKDVIVLDPAYGMNMIGIRAALTVAGAPVLGALAYNVHTFGTRRPFVPAVDKSIARRSALKVAALFTATSYLASFQNGVGSTEQLEVMFRQAVVAGQLKASCVRGDFRNKSVLAIYPPGHYYPGAQSFGIKALFEDDKLRNSILATIAPLLGETSRGFFDGRHYDNGKIDGPPSRIFNLIDSLNAGKQPGLRL